MARVGQNVYVIGAGFSAGLGFPTINGLLQTLWPRLEAAGRADDLAAVIRFHHPEFNPARPETFVNIERLLSEMQANEQLFEHSRPAVGGFTSDQLAERRQGLLLELASYFHECQKKALRRPPGWLKAFVDRMKAEEAQIISFNWDLILDELLFGDHLSQASYGLGKDDRGPRLIKPHGSLNWYRHGSGRHLNAAKKFKLGGTGKSVVYAFRPFRAPISSTRTYMPLIVPPLYNKSFDDEVFKPLWQETVSVLSTAANVAFLGYSLADADFHARFILRCGFHNQTQGALRSDGTRSHPTGQAGVTIVDPDRDVGGRIELAVGWPCAFHQEKIEDWVRSWPPK